MGAKLTKGSSSRPRGISGIKGRLPRRLQRQPTDSYLGGEDDDCYKDMSGKRSFDDLYTLGKKLGQGTYATVFSCTHKKTGKERAVKVVQLDKLEHPDDVRALEEEIEILSQLQHKHIVRLYHVFRAKQSVWLVQELCKGGELFDRIVEKRNYCENDARELLWRALDALAYAHSKGVVHRDLKPENILLSSQDDDVELKLADFGMARHLSMKMDTLKTVCGSPGYMAPEIVLQQPYTEKVDMWALGSVAFCLLGGYNPWDDRSTALVFARIKRGTFRFDGPGFACVSEDAKDLIRLLLVKDPLKRVTAQAALQHRWFHVQTADDLRRRDLSQAQRQLQEYRKNKRFRAAANAVMLANRLTVLSSGRSLSASISSSGASSSTSTSSVSSLSSSTHSLRPASFEHGRTSSSLSASSDGSGPTVVHNAPAAMVGHVSSATVGSPSSSETSPPQPARPDPRRQGGDSSSSSSSLKNLMYAYNTTHEQTRHKAKAPASVVATAAGKPPDAAERKKGHLHLWEEEEDDDGEEAKAVSVM